MRHLGGLGAAAIVLLGTARVASAQVAPPHDDGIDLQLFDYAIGPKTFFTVDNADVATPKALALDAMVTFLTSPLTVYNSSGSTHTMIGTTRDEVVQTLTEMQLTGAYGLTDKIQVGASLPFVFALTGDGLDAMNGTPGSHLEVTALGDLMLEGKMRLWQRDQLRLAGIAALTLPTRLGSDGAQYTGDDLPTLEARAALQWSTGRLSLGANAGLLVRDPRTFYGTTIGQQLTWGGAAAVSVTDRFSLIGETYGRLGLQDMSVNNSPAETIGGLRILVGTSLSIVAGGGVGLDRAIGAPAARFFASVGYAPDTRDSDGDGIPNDRDKCPYEPEDKDGFQDEDGCPDPDNDGDGIPDKDDKCPDAAEDHDGFQDDDGCPDPDNDHDGIPDLQDKCPNDPEDGKPPFPHDGCPADKHDSDGDGIPDSVDLCPLEEEDKDGFEDGDGCPDPDNDGDGIPDSRDKCPLCPEDKDGFQDEDGCPDLDNDHDGIPDAQDKCPNDPETVNGFQDEDGCPDTGGLALVELDGDRLAVARVPPIAHGELTSTGQVIANQMALVMKGHSEVTHWLIALSQPDVKAAQAIADALKAYLIKKGVTAAIDVAGAAGAAKIAGVVQERAAPDAPFVCPPELVAKPRPDRITPKAVMPGVKLPDKPKDPDVDIEIEK